MRRWHSPGAARACGCSVGSRAVTTSRWQANLVIVSPSLGTKKRIDSGCQALNTPRVPLEFLSVQTAVPIDKREAACLRHASLHCLLERSATSELILPLTAKEPM